MPRRMKRCLALLALCACALSPALADTWTGTVKGTDTVFLEAPTDGILVNFALEVGQAVTAGEAVGSLREETVYCPIDGRIEAIHLEAGDDIDGTVLEIDPVSAYTLICTTEGAPRTRENMLLRSGETVYVRCTADGEHKALGRVTTIDGDSYQVEITSGALYIGEGVRIFRASDYADISCVGTGTVEASALVSVSGAGKLLRLLVSEGDAVTRGQALFAQAADAQLTVTIPEDGVVTAISATKGSRVLEDQQLATLATRTILSFPADAEDEALLRRGTKLWYYLADDPHENLLPATITRVLHDVGDAQLTVELTPEAEALLPIGMTVTVTDENF